MNHDGMVPGGRDSIFYREGSAGIIRGLILEADGSEEFFQDVQIMMRWDGTTRYQVHCPAGIWICCCPG